MVQGGIIIIGGGVIGASIAWHLARRGTGVTLVERDGLAAQASGASAGGVRQVNRDPREMPLAIAAIRRWHTLEEELDADCEFRMGGQLMVSEHEDGIPELQRRVVAQRALGLELQFLDAAEVQEVAPALAPGIVGGIFTADDGQASAPKTTRAFGAAAERAGATLRLGTTVTGIAHQAGRITGIETDQGVIGCDHLILAAGAWTPVLAGKLGIHLPFVTMALQMMAAGPSEPLLAPTVGALGRRLSLKQVPSGEFVIGGGWPGDADMELRVGTTRMASVAGSIEHASAILPRLRDLPLIRTWIGLEALCIDEVPVISSGPGFENLTIAAGFSGHGFAISPIVGQLLSELLLDGSPSLSLDAFAIERFAELPGDTPFPDWQAG
jgi:sarcosine oxidase subunit beta